MDDSDEAAKAKERANRRFEREELGELLRLFSALGITVAAGITGCFFIGLWLDGKLQELGWQTHHLPKAGGLVAGLALSGYWAYLRIVRHLRKFGEEEKE